MVHTGWCLFSWPVIDRFLATWHWIFERYISVEQRSTWLLPIQEKAKKSLPSSGALENAVSVITNGLIYFLTSSRRSLALNPHFDIILDALTIAAMGIVHAGNSLFKFTMAFMLRRKPEPRIACRASNDATKECSLTQSLNLTSHVMTPSILSGNSSRPQGFLYYCIQQMLGHNCNTV